MPSPVPWEHARAQGIWRAYRATTRAVTRTPNAFFSTPSVSGALAPMMYGTISYTFGLLGVGLFVLLFASVGGGLLALQTGEALFAALGVGYGFFLLIMYGIQAPLYGFLGIVFTGAISHGVLWLLGLRGARFEDTLRAVGYANAPYFWTWVPVLGWFLVSPWVIWLEAIALRRTHQVSLDKALLATLGWRVLMLICVSAMYALLIAMMLYLENA